MAARHQGAGAPAPAPAAPQAAAAQPTAGAPIPPGHIEAWARTDLWYQGKQVRAGERRVIPIEDYRLQPPAWHSAEDRAAAAQKAAEPIERKSVEDTLFLERVRRMGQDRERANLARAQAAEEQAERVREMARQNREIAQGRADTARG